MLNKCLTHSHWIPLKLDLSSIGLLHSISIALCMKFFIGNLCKTSFARSDDASIGHSGNRMLNKFKQMAVSNMIDASLTKRHLYKTRLERLPYYITFADILKTWKPNNDILLNCVLTITLLYRHCEKKRKARDVTMKKKKNY